MMSQTDAELAALAAEVEAELEPAVEQVDNVDADLEALLGDMDDGPAADEEALPSEEPAPSPAKPVEEPAAEPAAAPEAAAPEVAVPAATPLEEPAAPAEEPAAAAASGGKKPAFGAKRKGMAPVIKKKKARDVPEAAPEAAPSAAPSAEAAPAEEPEGGKENAEPAAAEPVAEEGEEPAAAESPAEQPAGAASAPPKAPTKPKVPGLARPAADKPAAAAPKPKPAAAAPKVGKGKKAAAAATAGGEAAAKGPKKPLSAYVFFTQAKRAEIKAEHPDLDFGGLGSKMGELWKGLSSEDKAPYEAQAQADKSRYTEEMAAAGLDPLAPKPKKAKRTKSAYQLFVEDKMPGIKAEHPKESFGALNKLVGDAWKVVGDEEKAAYTARAKELKAAAAAAGGEEEEPAPAKKRKAKAAPAGGAGPSRKKGPAAAMPSAEEGGEDEEDAWQAEAGAASAGESDDDEEAERMAVDWGAHPALMILSETAGGKYLVARRGLGLDQYGLVDASAAKAQRLGGGADCPVSLEQVEEYESFKKGFKRAVHDNTDRDGLCLEDLAQGSLLEACSILGVLQAEGYELSKTSKGDRSIKVPLLGISRVGQRLVMVERERAALATAERDAAIAERDQMRAKVAQLEARLAGGAPAEDVEGEEAAQPMAAQLPLAGKAAAAAEVTPRRLAEA